MKGFQKSVPPGATAFAPPYPPCWGTPTVPHPHPCHLLMGIYCHRIHGTGIFTYMNGWFLWFSCMELYKRPMDPMGLKRIFATLFYGFNLFPLFLEPPETFETFGRLGFEYLFSVRSADVAEKCWVETSLTEPSIAPSPPSPLVPWLRPTPVVYKLKPRSDSTEASMVVSGSRKRW